MNNNCDRYLGDALKSLYFANKTLKITIPMIKEKKLMINVFLETYKSLINIISAIFEYEEENSQILNLNEFIENYSDKYGFDLYEFEKIQEIFEIKKFNNNSVMLFSRKNKIVMMSNELETKAISFEDLDEYLFIVKKLFLNVYRKINQFE